jgi:hypothetical protein
MGENHTTAAVQLYLDAPAEETPGDPLIRALLDRGVGRLEMPCGTMLFRSYPRPRRPPLNLQTDEVLGPVVERRLRTRRAVRRLTVRASFALANRHITWELNDLARRLDGQPDNVELCEVPVPASSGSGLTPAARRILEAIDGLPADEREAFLPGAGPGADAGGGRRGAGRVDQDGAAATGSCGVDAGEGAGSPPPHVEGGRS